jgi:hypothetical protein
VNWGSGAIVDAISATLCAADFEVGVVPEAFSAC